MATNAVFRGLQVGVEGDSTPGTAVAASKRMLCTRAEARPMVPRQAHRGTGSRYMTHTTTGKEHTELRVTGESVGYDDLAYWLATLKEVSGGSPYTVLVSPFAADDPATLTVEIGNADRAERVAGVLLSGLGCSFSQSAVTWDGAAFGLAQEEGATITTSPTVLATASVHPKSWRVSVGDTLGGLAALDRPLMAEMGLRSLRRPGFYGNSDASYTDWTELGAEASARLVLERNSVGAGYMADLRSSARKYVQIRAVDGSNELRIRMCVEFLSDDPGAEEDLWCARYTLQPVYDATLGGAVEFYLANSLSGL